MRADALLGVTQCRLTFTGPRRRPAPVRRLDDLAVEQRVTDLDRRLEHARSGIGDRDGELRVLPARRRGAGSGRLGDGEIALLVLGRRERRLVRLLHGGGKADRRVAIQREHGRKLGLGRALIVAGEGIEQRAARRFHDRRIILDLALGQRLHRDRDGRGDLGLGEMRQVGIVALALIEAEERAAAGPTGGQLEADRGAGRRAERQGVEKLDVVSIGLAEILHGDLELAFPILADDRADLRRPRFLELEIAQGRQARAFVDLARQDHRGLGLIIGGIGILIGAAGRGDDLRLVVGLAAQGSGLVLGNFYDRVEIDCLARQQHDRSIRLARIGRRRSYAIP